MAAIAAAKHSNAEFEERQRLAALEAAERRNREERRRLTDQRALAVVEQLVDFREQAERMRAVAKILAGAGSDTRTGRLRHWAERRLGLIDDQLGTAAIESRLADAGLFDPEHSR